MLKVDIFGELELLDELRVMVDPYCNSCEPNLLAKKCRIDISGGLKLLSAKVDCSVGRGDIINVIIITPDRCIPM